MWRPSGSLGDTIAVTCQQGRFQTLAGLKDQSGDDKTLIAAVRNLG
jgi:hypothetical protein